MCAVDCRLERATRECFLVIRTGPGDTGRRPLTEGFVTPEITVASDGHPKVTVWNLGTREVSGVTAEFFSVPAGRPVVAENLQALGRSIPAIIGPGASITLTCPVIWPGMNNGDVLLATVSHPELDPVTLPANPLADRHVGQMNHAWSGRYEGKCRDADETRIAFDIRPASRALYRVKVFLAVDGRLPGNPQVDRVMKPTGERFQWLEFGTSRKDFWEFRMLDNQQATFRCTTRTMDLTGEAEAQVEGRAHRV